MPPSELLVHICVFASSPERASPDPRREDARTWGRPLQVQGTETRAHRPRTPASAPQLPPTPWSGVWSSERAAFLPQEPPAAAFEPHPSHHLDFDKQLTRGPWAYRARALSVGVYSATQKLSGRV